jgi:hypothetical protein
MFGAGDDGDVVMIDYCQRRQLFSNEQGLFQMGKKVNTAIAGAVRSDHKRSGLENGHAHFPLPG